MKRLIFIIFALFLSSCPLAAQKQVWVLRAPGTATAYDATTFTEKQTIKIPPEAVSSPQGFSVNHEGQMLYAASASLPLAEGDAGDGKKIWFWNGHEATTLTRELSRSTATTGSNLAITESAPTPALAANGNHLYWFANHARRLQRDGVDLSTKTTWTSWQTNLAGGDRQDMASIAIPDCSCPTGSCEETCPYINVWIPEAGLDKEFVATQFVAGQEQPVYEATWLYRETAGKWTGTQITPPLRRVLDADGDGAILEAIPDSGCCGWSNESDDQVVLHSAGKTTVLFDERSTYGNSDYDVSFYAENGKLSPDSSSVALTITATSPPNQPIQLAAEGQANPEELQRIRKALQELPAVEVKTTADPLQRLAFLPHASFVGWVSEKEILVVEDHLLVLYNLSTKARRKSSIRVEDAAHVFLR